MSGTAWKRIMSMERSASSSAKPRVLFILHLPPPVHGAAMMGRVIRESRLVADSFDGRFVNLSASESLSEVGRFSFRKLSLVFRLLRTVGNQLRMFHPDLVYLTPASSGLGLLKDCLSVWMVRRQGIRTVLHFHNKGVSLHQDRFHYDRLYRFLFRDAKVILLSGRLYPDVERYVAREDVSICPNGIDGTVCPAREGEAAAQLLFFSNLLPSKGVVDLLDACRILMERGYRFSCRLVGAPSASITAERLGELVAERNLEAVVRYDGPVYGQDKHAVWAGADLLVHPTRDDSFPLVILEAMAAGLAVVSTREGGIPDEVEEGVTGILCRKEDPAALAEAIGFLLEHPDLRREMGTAGSVRYKKLFTQEAFEHRFVKILEQYV